MSLILVVSVVGTLGSAPPRCDPMWLPDSRERAAAAFVVTPSADTIRDLDAPRFGPAGPVGTLEEALHGKRGPTRVRFAQLAKVIASDARHPLRANEQIVLVPWTYVEDCGPAPWSHTARWVPAGSAAFIIAWPRPRGSWVGDRPTFDVEVRGWQPIWRTNDSRWGERPGPLLSAEEFLSFYQELPTHEELAARHLSPDLVKRIRRRLPQLTGREPARTILGNLERYLASPR